MDSLSVTVYTSDHSRSDVKQTLTLDIKKIFPVR